MAISPISFSLKRYSRLAVTLLVLISALSTHPASGQPLDGQVVVDPANTRWLRYHNGGPFFMAGPGDPEDFLYRGSRNSDGTRNGDQQQLINKLIGTGANSIYMQIIRSHGGDGNSTHNPFIDSDEANGLDQDILDQWEGWFTQMDDNGIVIFLFFYDDSAGIWSGNTVPPEEGAFIDAIVSEFEHHKHLIWVVAEEYSEQYTRTRVSNIAARIRAADSHDHAIAVHQLSGLPFDFPNDSNLDQFAIQYNNKSASQLNSAMRQEWATANGRYNLNLSESSNWGTGATSRRKAWASAMGGAYVMVYQMDIAGTPISDLEDLGRLRTFMESTDFPAMAPDNSLAAGETEYLLADPGESYIAYTSSGSGPVGIQNLTAGSYQLSWLDTVTGSTVTESNVAVIAGENVWPRPSGIGSEAAVYVLRLDGANSPPVAHDQSLTTVESTSLSVTLTYSDPDGPGPYGYTIANHPTHGTLTGNAPNLVYTPDPGFQGPDSFTWLVNDGIDDSNIAAISITVQSNQQPVASDFNLVGAAGQPNAFSFLPHISDPDGPGPLTVGIVDGPSHGTVVVSGTDGTYTPDAGYLGTDTFTWQADDGLAASNVANANITVTSTIFQDDFNRSNSQTVGNGWIEMEANGQVALDQGTMCFDADDENELPRAIRGFPEVASGILTWTFDLDFTRTGGESSYAFRMQLGDGDQMSDQLPDEQGVAINLIWGGPNSGLDTHEGLGVVVDGSITQLQQISGAHEIQVTADLDQLRYSVEVAGARFDDIPFDEYVPIDTIRMFADILNMANFADRSVDNVLIEGSESAAFADGFESGDLSGWDFATN